jgi:membrane protease YdiL (CAAX protease family)
VFASDPLAEAVQRKVNLGHTYLYMTLAGGYIFALMSDDRLQRLVMVILLAMLALALWQKARDHLPYLLDPVAAPPSRVSAADGLIALVLFFMLQIALLVLLSNGKPVVLGLPLLMSFVVAGAVTACVMIFAFKYFDTQGLPVLAGPRVWRGIGLGILAGLIAAGLAGVYLYMIPAEWLAAHQHGPKPSMFGLTLFAILAICAAPPIEEFIFRGLLFTGLERSWGGAVAIVASAALFAIVHPPVGMIPVFELGLATAIVYHYTKQLAAPIATHAAYNAVIVGAQFVA